LTRIEEPEEKEGEEDLFKAKEEEDTLCLT
jgi:hypothetical protein